MKLTEVFILSEAGKIESELGFTPEVAKLINQRAGKYAFTIASLIKNALNPEFYNMKDPEIYNRVDKDILYKDWETDHPMQKPYGYEIIDKLKKYPQFKERVSKAQTFDDAFNVFPKKMKKVKPESIVIKFSDGFFWTKLPGDSGSEAWKEESHAMGHCGLDPNSEMYSLRDKKNNPHVTITVKESYVEHLHGRYKIANQVVGKENKLPKRKYWPYVKKFVDDFKLRYANEAMVDDERDLGSEEERKAFFKFILKPEDAKWKVATYDMFNEKERKYVMWEPRHIGPYITEVEATSIYDLMFKLKLYTTKEKIKYGFQPGEFKLLDKYFWDLSIPNEQEVRKRVINALKEFYSQNPPDKYEDKLIKPNWAKPENW